MTLWQFLFLLFYALLMAVGQIVLKMVSTRTNFSLPFKELALSLMQNYFLWIGGFLYGLLMLMWIWILSIVPLSKAYPIAMLALFFTPILSYLIFHEKITLQYCIGIVLMFTAIYLIAT